MAANRKVVRRVVDRMVSQGHVLPEHRELAQLYLEQELWRSTRRKLRTLASLSVSGALLLAGLKAAA